MVFILKLIASRYQLHEIEEFLVLKKFESSIFRPILRHIAHIYVSGISVVLFRNSLYLEFDKKEI